VLIAAFVTIALAGLLAALSAAAFLRAAHGSPQRMLAPAQAAAAVILAAGALAALFGSTAIGLVGLVVCGATAVVTMGAAAWQVARYTTAAQQMSSSGGCGSSCGGCPSAGASGPDGLRASGSSGRDGLRASGSSVCARP
jgi:bacterioferritin-associated ferredoxin